MNQLNKLWVGLSISAICLYVYLSLNANLDLIEGRYALFMDERIAFDGVKAILSAKDFKAFLWAIYDGGDQRYGRIFWNVMAFFSFLPSIIWGDQGQIVAGRIAQDLLLCLSFLILTFTFVRSWFFRALLLLLLFSTPFVDYFSTMPKVEPLQLFLIAIFLYWYKKKDAVFDLYWIFLGLAFGAKVSILPLVALFFLYSYLISREKLSSQKRSNGWLKIVLPFLIGLGIAVPILLKPLSIFISGLFALWMGRKKLPSLSKKFELIIFLLSLYSCSSVLNSWMLGTYSNASHGSDSNSIGLTSWIIYYLTEWPGIPVEISIGIYLLIGIVVAVSFFSQPITKVVDLKNLQNGKLIFIGGFLLNLTIFYVTHRLWGQYLFIGTILELVGICSILENGCIFNSRRSFFSSDVKIFRLLSQALCLSLFVLALVYWLPARVVEFVKLSQRTADTNYQLQRASYMQVMNYLDAYQVESKIPITVLIDPSLFIPDNSLKFVMKEFWGDEPKWEMRSPIIFLSQNRIPTQSCELEVSQHEKCIDSHRSYFEHISSGSRGCNKQPCYFRRGPLKNGGEILELMDF